MGVDLSEREQVDLARALEIVETPLGRWVPNSMYGALDSAVLRAMLLHFRPSHVFEVGSGFSTAVALDCVQHDLPSMKITCVEPYPDRLLSRLRSGDRNHLELISVPIQDLQPEDIASRIGAGDVLFIDSTHVVKAGSDVGWLLLHTLPLLSAGVIVHIHDVHWPFEYPDHWLREGRNWTEAYLLHAFLVNNDSWKVLLFNSWLSTEHPDELPEALRGVSGGSIWLERYS